MLTSKYDGCLLVMVKLHPYHPLFAHHGCQRPMQVTKAASAAGASVHVTPYYFSKQQVNLLKSLSVQLGPSKAWESPRDLLDARRGWCLRSKRHPLQPRWGHVDLGWSDLHPFVEEESISWGHGRYPSLNFREESWVVLWVARNQRDLYKPSNGNKKQLPWLCLGQATWSSSSTAKPGMLSGGGVLVFGGLKGKDECVMITSDSFSDCLSACPW